MVDLFVLKIKLRERDGDPGETFLSDVSVSIVVKAGQTFKCDEFDGHSDTGSESTNGKHQSRRMAGKHTSK